MMPARFLTCALLLPLLGAGESHAGKRNDGPWMTALQRDFFVTDMTTGDIDGDGIEETAICYQESIHDGVQNGGLAILKPKAGVLWPVFHAGLRDTQCDKVKIKGRQIGIRIRGDQLKTGKRQLIWTYGKELRFRTDKTHFFRGTKISASSTLKTNAANIPQAAIDGDLSTSWAEGAGGTGIGEELTITLPRPMDIAYIGIFGGHGGNQRTYENYNRIHRGSFEIQTEGETGDDAAGFNFADLGIDVGGDRIEFKLENRPELRYIRIDKTNVVKIILRIDSVYLGNRHDDTHVAELEIVPLLEPSETIDRSLPVAQAPPKKAATKPDSEDVEEAPIKIDPAAERAVQELDKGGRSVVDDDF